MNSKAGLEAHLNCPAERCRGWYRNLRCSEAGWLWPLQGR